LISLLRRFQKPLFIGVIAIFLIGTFVGLGGYLFTSSDTTSAVASVGDVKIPYQRYLTRVNNYVDVLRSRDAEVTDEAVREVKVNMLRDMIVDELLVAKAEELGLRVTDDELARDIRSSPVFQRGGRFDEETYFQNVRRYYRDSPQAYEENRRKTLLAGKMKQLVFLAAKITPAELKELYAGEKKNNPKNFEKEKAAFLQRAHQTRALEIINYHLRQIGSQTEIRSYLEQREAGA
jgi:peptidyl-prolyl cis-trans isomerase D